MPFSFQGYLSGVAMFPARLGQKFCALPIKAAEVLRK